MTTYTSADRAAQTTGFVCFATFVIALGGLLFGYNATVMAGESLTFWAYAAMSVVAMGVVCRFVPETKGKDLEEISARLAHRS